MTSEDLLIDFPVHRHLLINSKTLLENNCSTLDGTDCVDKRSTTTELGHIGPFTVARAMVVKDEAYAHCVDSTQRSAQPTRSLPQVSYDEARNDLDPFPDPSLLAPLIRSSTTIFVQLSTGCDKLRATTASQKNTGTRCTRSSTTTLTRFLLRFACPACESTTATYRPDGQSVTGQVPS